MNFNKKTIKNLLTLIKGEGFKVELYTKYGRYLIEFETTGLTVTSLRRLIEIIPSRAVFTSSPSNRCIVIDTGIKSS